MRIRLVLGLASIVLAGVVSGCGTGQGTTATEEQQRDPAWVQAQIREMDKNLTPDKPIPVKKQP